MVRKELIWPFADIGGDLPFVLSRSDEIRDQNREQIIVDHRAVVVALHAAAVFVKNRAPKEDGAGQRNEPEDGAQEIIPAVNEGILQTEIKDGEIFCG